MKKQFAQILAFTAVIGLALAARGSDDPDQSEFPQIASQPTDQDVTVGESTTFSVQATNGDLSFQWHRDGVPIEGQTNSSLTLENIGTNDVGNYSCNVTKGTETVPTRAASLTVTAMLGGQITVFGGPVISHGSQGSCPGTFAGYVNYTKTVSQGWGWAPTTGAPVHSATDITRTDTKVQYLGKNGDKGCNLVTVTLPQSPPSAKYRFTVYFPNNVPTGSYPLVLTGFDP